jgi:CDP-paratose 2-epimerase
VTIYGDGCQVRDILFIDDLVNALLLAQQHMGELAGEAFNIGGGGANTISLLEFIDLLGEMDTRPQINFSAWRTGDQKYYVSDTRKFRDATGWAPRVDVREGIRLLHEWLLVSQIASDHLVRQAS